MVDNSSQDMIQAHRSIYLSHTMTKEEFVTLLGATQPDILAAQFLAAENVTAFPNVAEYLSFKERVANYINDVESVSIVGTGNWRFSLNPDKHLKEFDRASDIDVAVISHKRFTDTWEELRRVHRLEWYSFDRWVQERLKRNGQNVYSGFVTP